MIPFRAKALDWLARSSNITVDSLRITPMRGANSSAVYAIEDAHKPRTQRFVLRVLSSPGNVSRLSLPFRRAI